MIQLIRRQPVSELVVGRGGCFCASTDVELIRDALRFMHGRHGWGWRYLNKYTPTGEPTLVLNHYEKVLDLVSRSQNHGATHGTGEHLVYLQFPTRFHFISRHGNIRFGERPGLISIKPMTEAEINRQAPGSSDRSHVSQGKVYDGLYPAEGPT
jgi:hypothetical protein